MSRTNGIFLAIIVCAVLAAVAFSLTDFLGDKVYASRRRFSRLRASPSKRMTCAPGASA